MARYQVILAYDGAVLPEVSARRTPAQCRASWKEPFANWAGLTGLFSWLGGRMQGVHATGQVAAFDL
ncbi:MAG: hypothetical protein IPJ46_00495, partial [Anaerolineales bacterium]|nr:hypothetical protein [Anaerolineales bacterium]